MTKIKETKTRIIDAYKELNERKKLALRDSFLKKFDYKAIDTFYKKLNGETQFWTIEKEWLAVNLEIPETELDFSSNH